MENLEPFMNVMVVFGHALTALAIYLTIVSGYLVVAYAVGRDLDRFQVLFINAIFFIFATILAIFSSLLFYSAFSLGPREGAPNHFFYGLYLFFGCEILAIIGAIKFMQDIRKKN